MRAARRLCQWLEQHVPDFCTDTHRLDGLIRVAEFTIVLLGLTRPLSSGASGDVYARWAHGVADVLWADLHRKEKYVLRSLAATRSAHARALLLPFPALETITRRRFDNHALVRALLSEGAGRTGHLEVDVAFACDVAGLGDCREATWTRLAELSGAAGPPGESVQGMYDLTHLAFYATILGRRSAHWSPGMAGWARAFLEEGGAVFLRRHDLDLVAECVMSLLSLTSSDEFLNGTGQHVPAPCGHTADHDHLHQTAGQRHQPVPHRLGRPRRRPRPGPGPQ
ncbi:DUF6895 family protein [Streptomyces sp. NBC_01320]|uniref:DUF6895 family protein n=1 Tax=Streptomyces sp. NBC_01320 TaxID=2903824 RepID=UPI002E1444F7|nr:hypothetical protein OG395_07315 [Streptomyces sp. NBC_01320]